MEYTYLQGKGDYIAGRFIKSSPGKEYSIISPADLKDKVFTFFSYPEHIELAVSTAARAYSIWSALSQEERNTYLKKLAQVYKDKKEELAVYISRETGKPLWESRQEAGALAQKIKITLEESLPLVRDTELSSQREGVKGKIAYRSRGVFLILGPFNFPVHLPNGQIVSALALGNTVIFKASEKTPASAEILAECFDLAGFPKGVFNLIQGGAETAQALVRNQNIDGILFTGSYTVGKKIQAQILDQPHKILALEMGGKNSSLVWKNADIEKSIYEILKGAYLTCGQRCSSTSRLIVHKEIKSIFLKKFIALSRKIKIGHWKDNPFMGPLIEEKSVHRFLKALEEAKENKDFVHLSGGKIDSLNGFYVRPVIVEPRSYDKKSFHQNEELFAPFLTVYEVNEEEEAMDLINKSAYGLCLSVFSKDSDFVKRIFQKAQVGVFHWNLSSVSASSKLPFGGLGKSGNDRPAGLFAVHSCVTPVAWMQAESSLNPVLSESFFTKEE